MSTLVQKSSFVNIKESLLRTFFTFGETANALTFSTASTLCSVLNVRNHHYVPFPRTNYFGFKPEKLLTFLVSSLKKLCANDFCT